MAEESGARRIVSPPAGVQTSKFSNRLIGNQQSNLRTNGLLIDEQGLLIAGKTILRFAYHLVKLKSLDYKEYLNSQNPLAFALMAKMNYNRKDQVRMKADFLRLILGSRVDPARQSVLVDFVETYLPLIGEELERFEQLIQNDDQYAEVEQMVTVYEQRGIDKGIEKGIEKGLVAGKVQMIEQILGQEETDLLILEKMSIEELQGRLDSLQTILKKQNV